MQLQELHDDAVCVEAADCQVVHLPVLLAVVL